MKRKLKDTIANECELMCEQIRMYDSSEITPQEFEASVKTITSRIFKLVQNTASSEPCATGSKDED